ncbi:response regulator [Pedobacter mucosus]|uniref:response regulator n=1 Tax=Pedobacter mucosus TaxID=2895286 RepID=UPI001EE44A45|nr:response regulator [Pedobacter mucosus]UKT62159.1 response regulator [Pedobacter mucosus]
MNDRVHNKILVIDDDPGTLEVIKLIFEIEDYIVMGKDNCANIDNLLDSFKPDIVLMDVIMGSVDGRDVCKELKTSRFQNIPVILMSVISAFHNDPLKPLYSDDYIEKPFELEDMISKVKHLLSTLKER